jgi:hypothetical protein
MKHSIDSLKRITLASMIALELAACGGGGGSGGGGGASTTAISDAGEDRVAARGAAVTLDGSGSSDSAGGALSYSWRQTRGTDVTNGAGVLTGARPIFAAPDKVETLSFELSVNGGAPDTVHVNVLEHNGRAFFVDGDNGSDATGDGSMANPFASISHALSAIDGPNIDIYVRSMANGARYDETAATLALTTSSSLYGGYGAEWVRDVSNNRTGVDGHSRAVNFSDVSADAWFSGFDLAAADGANASSIVSGVSAKSGQGALTIEDNLITAGSVGPGVSGSPASSYGLRLAGLSSVQVLRNDIIAGSGGKGQNGVDRFKNTNGSNGSNSTNINGGGGGAASNPNAGTNGGGHGGSGGGLFGTGFVGGNGHALPDGFQLGHPQGGGGAGGTRSSQNGQGGFGGDGGRGGDGGGGGGGAGGRSGEEGGGGIGGGGSFGILLSGIANAVVEDNFISSGVGGDGGRGGNGGSGGDGGTGGSGAPAGGLGSEAGGHGGGGGKGGEGGQGGGGAGGPSLAILVDANMAPIINNNTLTSGAGGLGGDGGDGGRKGRAGSSGSDGGAGATFTDVFIGPRGAPSEGGYSYGIYDLDTNDGLVPSVSGNTFSVGTPAKGGSSGEANF